MSARTLAMTGPLYEYWRETAVPEAPALAALREETAAMPQARMQISPEQGRFLAWLVRLTGARRCLEIGTFTGYSAMAVAAALPAGGRLVACDVSEEWTAIALRHWVAAGLGERISLRLGPALATLDALLQAGEAGGFDFAFIDADKEGYAGYYERCLRLVRQGGLIAVDNVLWGGAVADPADERESTRAIRAFNAMLFADARVDACLLPIGDGLTLARVL